jgi:glycosyltransferase involved in cell wall biosynthesis
LTDAPRLPQVLTFVEWYLPGEGAGGPVHSIDALIHRLDGCVRFDVVTRQHDLGDDEPYPGVPAGVWLAAHPGRRRYLRRRDERPLAILRLLRRTRHDSLYINTLYSVAFALYPLLFRRLGLLRPGRMVVAPRGQLDPGALAIHPVRKRTYLALIRALGLFEDVEWHASSADEEAHIRLLLGDASIHVAPNLRRPVTVPVVAPSPAGTVRIVFLSRISQKKNLVGALRMLAGCTSPIEFDIYGQQEDPDYWRTCRELIATLPSNVSCSYGGVVPHADVARVLAAHDLLLLPTYGENFGHVIGEALEAGCLALVSDRTPWRGLAAQSAGWDLSLDDPAAFVAAIEEYARLDEDQRIRRRRCARQLATTREAEASHVAANVRLLSAVSEPRRRRRGRTPTC